MRQALLTFLRNPVRTLFIAAIRGYQIAISPGLPGRCKYYPSCSQYGIDAIREYGAARGLILASWRILRCNPLSYGGYDPVSRQKLFAHKCSHGSEGHLDSEAAVRDAGAGSARSSGSPVLPGGPGIGA
jgi:putative membrane protein insertion efficiency factor